MDASDALAPNGASAQEKRGLLTGGALTDEALDSSPSVLRRHRGGGATVGLQQYFTPEPAARLIASVVGRAEAVLDPTAGAGNLLSYFPEDARYGIEIDGDHVRAATAGKAEGAEGALLDVAAAVPGTRYRAALGDVQRLVPMLRAAGLRWPSIVANPPFGEAWRDAARPATKSSTVLAYLWALDLLSPYGQGAILLGTDRLAREVMPLPEASGIYAVVDVAGPLFEGVSLPTSIAFFVHPENARRARGGATAAAPPAANPRRFSAPREDLQGLLYDLRAARDRAAPLVITRAADELPSGFRAVAEEARRRARASGEGKTALRDGHDVALRGKRIVALPKPYARLVLSERGKGKEIAHLHNQNVAYFGQNPRAYRLLEDLEGDGVITVSPQLKARAEQAIAEAAKVRTPLSPIRPHMRLGWLTDLEKILCVKDDPERGFCAGQEYDLQTASETDEAVEYRIVKRKDGTPERRKFTVSRRLLRVTIGRHDNSGNRAHIFDEGEESTTYLLKHFELPDPGCVASRHPELYERNRRVITEIQADYGLLGTDREMRPFQIDNDARLLVKRRGVLGHKQGLGKTLQQMMLEKAEKRLGADPQSVQVAPQDLLPQWQAERRKFFGERYEVIGGPADARRISREIRDDPKRPRAFLTHFEALSRVGRKREALPEEPLDHRPALTARLDAHKAEKRREAEAGGEAAAYRRRKAPRRRPLPGAGWRALDGARPLRAPQVPQDDPSEDPAGDPYARFLPAFGATTRDACPNCRADTDLGWNGEVCTAPKYCRTHGRGGACEHEGGGEGCVLKGCGYVHTRVRVKPAASHLTKCFRGGVKLVDELTEISGDSQKSEALRAMARGTARQGGAHNYGSTGTPQKNYAFDTFFAFQFAFGLGSVAFPYDYNARDAYAQEFNIQEVLHGRREDGEEHLKVRRKTLPILTNVSQFWRMTQPMISRCRKEQTGEPLVPLTYHLVEVPMGSRQQKMHAFWLQNFPAYFAWRYPHHPLVKDGLVEKWAAGLGQRWRLEAAATLPGWDAPSREWPVARAELGELSNWTPAMLKLLETVMEHVAAGEKVLVGSCLKELGPFVAGALNQKGVKANHITEVRQSGAGEGANRTTVTKSPKKRARAVREFIEGDARVLCAGVQALKLGHSLEAASAVVILGLPDSWVHLDQFLERVHRLTSKKPVNVHIILPRDSMAQEKHSVLQKKGNSSDLAFDGQFMEQEERPVNWEEVIREMRRRGIGLRATTDLVPEEEVEAAWRELAPVYFLPAPPNRPVPAARPAPPLQGALALALNEITQAEPFVQDSLFG